MSQPMSDEVAAAMMTDAGRAAYERRKRGEGGKKRMVLVCENCGHVVKGKGNVHFRDYESVEGVTEAVEE